MIIGARFNGPPGTGNGGYCSGVFADAAGLADATVTLRQPPPLEVPLDVRPSGAGIAVYAPDDGLVAEVAPAASPSTSVAPVSLAAARAVSASYPGFVDHPFPTCFVCGPERPDGLRIFPGMLSDGRTAAVWTVPADVTMATAWAALDCPGGWTIVAPGRPYVLGRMTGSVRAVPEAGSECVVVGELVSVDGRKAHVRTALYAAIPNGGGAPPDGGAPRSGGAPPDGEAPLAAATAVWLAI